MLHGFLFLQNLKYFSYIFIFIILSPFTYGQDFSGQIKQLNKLGLILIDEVSDVEKYEANKEFKLVLQELIRTPNSFDNSFDSLKTISILQTEKIKLYNWTIPLNDGSFEYFAYLQIKREKDEYSIVELIDQSDNIKSPENKILTPKNWYGALYYKIIENKKIGKNTYTLLGWDGNNQLTNKKIIEVLSISENGLIKLGAPILKTKKRTKRRMIFEYSESAVMSLKYHKSINKIVFDYLVPTSSKLAGIPEYYGPALNRFDAFEANKGKWIYQEDVDIELDRNIKDFLWEDPKEE